MGRLAKRLKWYLENVFGLDRLGPEVRPLCWIYVTYLIIWALQTVFINTLLYRVTGRADSVLGFNMLFYVGCSFFMTLSAYFAKKTSPVVVMRMGACGFILMYLLLFFAIESADKAIVPLALAYGWGLGFYFSGHNTLLTAYTTPSNRDVAVGFLCILQGIITLVMPVLSGFVISLFDGLEGYYLMFGFALLSALLIMLLTTRLKPVQVADRRSRYKLAWQLLRTHATNRIMLASGFSRGLRDGVLAFYLNLLLFQIIQDESLIGFNTLLTGVASILAAWAYGKLVTPASRAKWVVIAVTCLLASFLPLLWWMLPAMLMAASVVNGFFNFFIVNPGQSTDLDVMAATVVAQKCIAETMAFREWMLTLGRCAGMTLVLLMPRTNLGSVLSILILTGSQYALAVCVAVNNRILSRHETRAPLESVKG